MLRNGLSGGVLIGKDGGNFWRSIFNRFGPSGPEIGTGHFITSEWLANQWHHSAFTWGPSSLKLYIDGKLAASSVPAVAPPVVSDPDLQLGADGLSAGVDAVLDELRISDRERTAAEVFDSFIRGLTLTSLSANPSTVDILATWPITIRLTAATNLGSIDLPMSSATWMISDNTVVQDLGAGQLRAKAPGTATLTATLKGVSTTIQVTVRAPVLPPLYESIPPFLATPVAGYRHEVPLLIIRYLPTANGIDLDTSVSPDFYSLNPITLASLRAQIGGFDQRVKFVLEQGSRFRAYHNTAARPSLGYRVVDDISVFEQSPPGKAIRTSAGYPVYAPDWFSIFDRLDVAHYVNDLGVKEIWFWMGGFDASYPSYDPAIHKVEDFRSSWESNLSSPITGDVSNSNRDATDLPIYSHNYTVYGCNFRRSHAEAIHNHGHQIEAQLSYVTQIRDGNADLWWKQFVGQDAVGNFITGRCGWTHMPPNTTSEYDYVNPTLVPSDVEDWKPDHSGAQTLVNVNTWGNKVYTWPDGVAEFPQRVETQWYLYWMQSIPGFANGIPRGSDELTNWWDFLGAWDASIVGGEGLHATPPILGVPRAPAGASILELRAIAPNPMRGSSRVAYSVPRRMRVEARVSDLHGRVVRNLFDGVVDSGEHAIQWDGLQNRGGRVGPGVYFIRLQGEGCVVSRRIVVM